MPPEALPIVLLDRIISWYGWRKSKRKSIPGWFAVFAGQLVAGIIVFSLLRILFGIPFNPVSGYFTLVFAVSCGVSGIGFSIFWGAIFAVLSHFALGLSVGIWPLLRLRIKAYMIFSTDREEASPSRRVCRIVWHPIGCGLQG